MSDFRADMKIMFKLFKRKMAIELIKSEIILIGFYVLVLLPLKVPLILMSIVMLIPVIAVLICYFILYLSTFRTYFREERERIRRRDKYGRLWGLFVNRGESNQ